MMIHRQQHANFLKRHGLIEEKGEHVQEAYRVFLERTEGLLDIAWAKAFGPDQLKQAILQFGFDCYTQGCVDGATTVKMRPELIEYMTNAETVTGEK